MSRGMKRRVLVAFAVLAISVTAAPAAADARPSHGRVGACAASHAKVTDKQAVRKARLATLCLLNRVRARAGLRPLRLSPKLSRAARRHSRDMVRHRYFSHNSRNGRSAFDRMLRTGYVPRNASWALGENIGWGSGNRAGPAALVRMWMHSPGHRANILNGRFRHIGIGIALGTPARGAHASRYGRGATYTTDFGFHS